MDILVVGGDGFVGRHLCAALADRGHDLAVLSRTPDASVLPDGTETISGDVRSYDSIKHAFGGRDAVVNLVALSPMYQPAADTSHEKVHVGGTRNVVGAAREQGVDKLVQMSSVGTKPDGATGYIRAKGQAEWVVLTADLDAVILRPNIMFGDEDEFTNFINQTTLPYMTALPGGGKTPFQPLWVGDTAAMAAEATEANRHRNEIYELGGPEALTVAEVTKLLYQARGQSVVILPVPMKFVEWGLRAISPISSIPFGADQARMLHLDLKSERNDLAAFDRSEDDLTTLEAYFQTNSAM